MIAYSNAVVGVVMAGAAKAGALCRDHWHALNGQDGLTFFNIKKGRLGCDACGEMRRRRDARLDAYRKS